LIIDRQNGDFSSVTQSNEFDEPVALVACPGLRFIADDDCMLMIDPGTRQSFANVALLILATLFSLQGRGVATVDDDQFRSWH